MIRLADTKPTADVEYLTSAIIHYALIAKFNELFGRDPVEKSKDAPLVVEDTLVPDMIADSSNQDVAHCLKASAVEHSKMKSGDMPTINNATMLYTVLEDNPAKVSLESVPEYKQMDSAASDATLSAVGEQEIVTVKDGVAYVSAEASTIEIGIFSGNKEFAALFQQRLANSGGEQISEQDKLKVFDTLYTELPGGEALKESNARNTLLKVVGLTEALPPNEKTPEAMKAPGPQPVN